MNSSNAFRGALAADALAMPVHWYYDTAALVRDYGRITHFVAPKNPHPDSILWRSFYNPVSPEADILHEQAQWWGKRGVHYHQFLSAGENTLNFQLASVLHDQLAASGEYDPDEWLAAYVDFMRTPGRHRDTYVEEYHRAFFNNLALGKKPSACGVNDIHIGGLVPVPAIFSALPDADTAQLRTMVQRHVQLTHKAMDVLEAADCLIRMLCALRDGKSVREAILTESNGKVSERRFTEWQKRSDEYVVGKQLSPACYIDDAFPAALYLAWKYHDNFDEGIAANANVGGDNCHRGAVVGSLLGAVAPVVTLAPGRLGNLHESTA